MSNEINEIFSFVRRLWNLKGLFDKAKRERRERIATYLEQIRDCLLQVSAQLRIDQYPHGSCREMAKYAEQLPGIVRSIVSEKEAEELKTELLNAHRLERSFSEVCGRPDKDEKLAKLEEAAGILKALANSLRAM